MTVQEAKGFIQGKLDCMNKCDVFECKGTDECENCNYCYSQGNFGEQKEAFKFAIECMEEVEQYRALGTVEELKEAKKLLEKLEELKFANEQPKTDWIPCEERLPELDEGTESFKQSKCCLVALEWWDGEITEEVGWYNQSGVWNQDSKNCKVIAWQPLPAPYKKEGAE